MTRGRVGLLRSTDNRSGRAIDDVGDGFRRLVTIATAGRKRPIFDES